MPTREEFVAQWEGRVGEDAANLSVLAARAIGTSCLLLPVWGSLFVVGAHSLLLSIVAWAVAVASVVLLVIGMVLQHRLNALLSRRFGTRVWFLDSPSLREGQFQAWCGRHGVVPESGTPASSAA